MPKLNAAFPIVDTDGKMEQIFRIWAGQVNDALPLTGIGSPEGVIFAVQFSLYLDKTGSAGSIEYRKMQTDIAGDNKKGWLAV